MLTYGHAAGFPGQPVKNGPQHSTTAEITWTSSVGSNEQSSVVSSCWQINCVEVVGAGVGAKEGIGVGAGVGTGTHCEVTRARFEYAGHTSNCWICVTLDDPLTLQSPSSQSSRPSHTPATNAVRSCGAAALTMLHASGWPQQRSVSTGHSHPLVPQHWTSAA
jgi:hypothetical protein